VKDRMGRGSGFGFGRGSGLRFGRGSGLRFGRGSGLRFGVGAAMLARDEYEIERRVSMLSAVLGAAIRLGQTRGATFC
jgi:hypothetical protein